MRPFTPHEKPMRITGRWPCCRESNACARISPALSCERKTTNPLVGACILCNATVCQDRLTANCIIIAPKRLKLRLSGSARKSPKRFRDTPRFKFRAVLARTQPFLSRSVEKRGDQSRFKCSKMVNHCAIRSRTHDMRKREPKKPFSHRSIQGHDPWVCNQTGCARD